LHEQGVMTMLTEAIKGVQRDIHSSGLAVLRHVLKQSVNLSPDELSTLSGLLAGILTCLIHHVDADGFQPIFQTILDYVDECTNSARVDAIGLASNLVFVMVTVRNGSRIADWPRVMKTLRLFLDFGRDRRDLEPSTRQSMLSAVGTSFQTAPIDAILPALGLLESTRSSEWKPFFLPFCDLFSRLGRERFQQFLLAEFQKFIVEQWKESLDLIVFYLPKLAPFERSLHFPESFQILLVDRLHVPAIGRGHFYAVHNPACEDDGQFS
jgi:U3 small nucleolar RNA-associated protein 20